MKNYVVGNEDIKKIVPFFNTKIGQELIQPVFRLLALDKVNGIYSRCCHLSGPEFSTALLEDLQITTNFDKPLDSVIPSDGPFITISNHPFGALDGITLISRIGALRPDFKMMVNSLLGYIEAMSPNFIKVEPYQNKIGSNTNIHGIKESMRHISDGHPLGFFPAGGVSRYQKNLKIKDNPWALNVIRLIQQMKVDVIPLHFHGSNSHLFNLLGLINWRLRSLRLPREVFSRAGSTLDISVGNIIKATEISDIKDIGQLSEFLYERTYACGR